MKREKVSTEIIEDWQRPFDADFPLKDLEERIANLCSISKKEAILMIDEVDKSSDNQVFLTFLGMLRNKYLKREEGVDFSFKSVILAGVYDVKNLKLKIRPEEEKKYNSPWNIAVDFKVDMSFSVDEIAGMLKEYEKENLTGMDIGEISKVLYDCTSGYPSLVSRLCKWIDEEGKKEWTLSNLKTAQKELLKERNTLFDDLIKNVENHKELKELIMSILNDGVELGYSLYDPVTELGSVFGILKNKNGKIAISNRVFETCLYDYTISIKEREEIKRIAGHESSDMFVKDGSLDMPRVLLKFQEIMKSEYREEDERFVEQQGRLLFLCFLKPIINGTGFYYVEPETRSSTRMDLVVSYGSEEHIIELKIWHGEKYRRDGIRQLTGYMDSRKVEKGYLISFSFGKDKENRSGWLETDETGQGKEIFEVIV